MKTVTLLGELQALDTKLDEYSTTRATLKAKLADATALNDARAALDTIDKADSDLQAKLRALELETGGLSENSAKSANASIADALPTPKNWQG